MNRHCRKSLRVERWVRIDSQAKRQLLTVYHSRRAAGFRRWFGAGRAGRTASVDGRTGRAAVARTDPMGADMGRPGSRRPPWEVLLLWGRRRHRRQGWKSWALGRAPCRRACPVCRAGRELRFVILLATLKKTKILTSFVLRLGVDRDELDPERDGGRSLAPFKLLEPALSLPFSPTLSRSRLSSDAWSPFGRGDGVPCEIEENFCHTILHTSWLLSLLSEVKNPAALFNRRGWSA